MSGTGAGAGGCGGAIGIWLVDAAKHPIMQRTDTHTPPTQNYPAQDGNVNSAKVETDSKCPSRPKT